MSLTPEELKRFAQIASIYKPSQLRKKAEFYLKTLLFQHDCLMVDCINGLDHDFDKYFGPMTALMRDQLQLRIMLELLESIDVEYEQASPSSVEAYLEECRSDLDKQSSELTRARRNLEKLFDDSPNADHF